MLLNYCKLYNFFQKGIAYFNNMEILLEKLNEDKTVGIVPRIFFNDYASRHFDYQQIGLYTVADIPKLYYCKGFLMKHDSVFRETLNAW